jgi:hypothetical protein
MWTIAAVLLTTEAVVSIAQAVVQQGGIGRITVFPDEPAFTADVSADGRLAAVFTQPYNRGTKQTPARIEIRNLQTGERMTLPGGVSNARASSRGVFAGRAIPRLYVVGPAAAGHRHAAGDRGRERRPAPHAHPC